MKTYQNSDLIQKYLSSVAREAHGWENKANFAKQGYPTGLKGFDWQIGSLRAGDVLLLVGPNKRLNQAFCAFIMHALCWRHKLSGHICSFDELADRWLGLLLSAETGIAADMFLFSFSCKAEDSAKIQKACADLEKLPLSISEIAPKEALAEGYVLPAEKVVLLADFPLEDGRDYEEFFRELKKQASREGKIMLVSCLQEREFGEQMNMGTPLRRYGLLDAWCDFVCLLGDTPPQHFDETGTEIPAKPYVSDSVSFKTLKNARLPSGFAEFTCHFYNPDFKDKPNLI